MTAGSLPRSTARLRGEVEARVLDRAVGQPDLPVAREGRDDALRADPSDRVVPVVRHVDVARGVQVDIHRVREAADTVVDQAGEAVPADGAHEEVGRDAADPVPEGVRDHDDAARVDRDPVRPYEGRLGSRPVERAAAPGAGKDCRLALRAGGERHRRTRRERSERRRTGVLIAQPAYRKRPGASSLVPGLLPSKVPGGNGGGGDPGQTNRRPRPAVRPASSQCMPTNDLW